MTCTVLLGIKVKKEHADGMAEGFKGLFPDTRSYDGNIDLYVSRDQDDPQSFVIVETWETRQKYEAYLAWRTERGDMDNLATLLDGEPSIRYLDRLGA
jgi:quinol monooxygenase YgiN